MSPVPTSHPRWPRFVAPVAALAMAAALLVSPSTRADPAGCPNQDSAPADVGEQVAAAATLCLLNQVRAGQALAPLAANARLAQAAQGHAEDMVAHHFFAHDSSDGRHFDDRITAADYLTNAGKWSLAENLAWGTNNLATPAAIVSGWMNSPEHKTNILGPYSEIGIAIVNGDPNGDSEPGGTYVTDFGQIEPLAGASPTGTTGKAHTPRRRGRRRGARPTRPRPE